MFMAIGLSKAVFLMVEFPETATLKLRNCHRLSSSGEEVLSRLGRHLEC